MKSLKHVEAALKEVSDLQKAKILMSFFKTGDGEYGEGDVFLGVTVPKIRLLAKKFSALPVAEVEKILKSRFHEARLLGLLIMVEQYQKGTTAQKLAVYRAYLRNIVRVNNWDLVDLSAPHILGEHLSGRDRTLLLKMARSKDIWLRRISILATFNFIRRNDFKDALKISKQLLNDEEDLIHKAVGWMLREIGKRDMKVEEAFLKQHHPSMPRTMLRYAIERFPEERRLFYLKKRATNAPH